MTDRGTDLQAGTGRDSSSSQPYRGRWTQNATKEELLLVLDSAPCGIFVVEGSLGESLYINPEVLKISGYDLQDIPTARVARKALFQDDKTRRQQAKCHTQMMRGPTTIPFLSRIVRKDGTTIICEVRCVELPDGMVVGVWTDVTRREVAEEELRKREARFRSLFEDSFDAVLLLEQETVVDCNHAAQSMFGKTRKADLLGRTFGKLTHPGQTGESATTKIGQVIPTMARKRRTRFEALLRRADGEPFPAEITAIGLRLEGKDIIHVMIRDITVLKEAEKGLRAAKERLEERVRERTEELVKVNRELKRSREELRLLSEHLQRAREGERTAIAREVHDELGQLLTALKMDVAYSEGHLREEDSLLRDHMHAMERQIDGGINTVRKICADLRPHVLERLGLSAGIEWFVGGFKKRTGIECRLVIEADFFDPGKDLSLIIFRVLQEAMTNVARHAAATAVEIDLRRKADRMVLRIRDNGRGITKADIDNPESFGIIGIRERIRFWGGRSSFKGSPKTGTSITINLPLSKNARDQASGKTGVHRSSRDRV
jgi:PAS domain S-box-containing protein